MNNYIGKLTLYRNIPPAATSNCDRPGRCSSACGEPPVQPGTTKRIAFMMKQQTAFRYLHADMPFFIKTAEAAG